jgi:high mobility group protein B3
LKVAKEGGERWKSMTDEVSPESESVEFPTLALHSFIHAMLFIFLDQEKKPYIEKAAELKAEAENGEGSGVSPSSFLCLLLSFCGHCHV